MSPGARNLAGRALGLAALLLFLFAPFEKDGGSDTGLRCLRYAAPGVWEGLGTNPLDSFSANGDARHRAMLEIGLRGFLVAWIAIPLGGLGLLVAPRSRTPRLPILGAIALAGGSACILVSDGCDRWIYVRDGSPQEALFYVVSFLPLAVAATAVHALAFRGDWGRWIALALTAVALAGVFFPTAGWGARAVGVVAVLALALEGWRWRAITEAADAGSP